MEAASAAPYDSSLNPQASGESHAHMEYDLDDAFHVLGHIWWEQVLEPSGSSELLLIGDGS